MDPVSAFFILSTLISTGLGTWQGVKAGQDADEQKRTYAADSERQRREAAEAETRQKREAAEAERRATQLAARESNRQSAEANAMNIGQSRANLQEMQTGISQGAVKYYIGL